MNKISGTKEWAKYTANCCTGCYNNCRFCYARHDAIERWKNVKPGEWEKIVINWSQVNKKRTKMDGTIMFPTTHDIFPENLEPCIKLLNNFLSVGNNMLIVSKPRLECIKKICEKFQDHKKQILFRFTIGAIDNSILKYWEPNAPTFGERFDCLQYTFNNGFDTSISCEPMLDSEGIIQLFDVLEPYVTDGIWIGKMNKIDKRVESKSSDLDKKMIHNILKGQTDNRILEIYNILKDDPKIRWKESFKSVLGLELAEETGEDK